MTDKGILITAVRPELDGGRYPVKRVLGDRMVVEAEIFKEGHDRLAAVLKRRRAGTDAWTETAMDLIEPGIDLWRAAMPLTSLGRWEYTIEAWMDGFGTWRDQVSRKKQAGQDLHLDLTEGRQLLDPYVGRASGRDRARLDAVIARFDQITEPDERAALLLAPELETLLARWPDRTQAALYRVLAVVVDRVAARAAAWYQMMPRSQGQVPGRSATFLDCARRLPEIRALGFDVVYLMPIHPIGRSFRKGRNNSLTAGPDEPGSPYAIGSAEGGHTAIHPDLGTLDDFGAFVAAAAAEGLEVALDIAIQCSPDHPWITEHPEWFQFRPDGSIRYAENPPKKYQDIVNLSFDGPHAGALWQALEEVFEFWIRQGVTSFRVDNPHTKPVPLWEWLIGRVKERHPQVLFLSEAFTRPPMLQMLAKIGFSQSYTYFTWRNFKGELTAYLTALVESETREYLRPHFFPTTADILPEYLQRSGRPGFLVRLILAATLSSLYGLYNGYELCEAEAVPGREEYLNSEKYEYKVWDWDRPGHIKAEIAAVNRIRRENFALQLFDNLRFYPADDDNILFYGKMTEDRTNMVFVAVNLDPFDAHTAQISFPLAEMGLSPADTYLAEELITGRRHLWSGATQSLRLDPQVNSAAIFRIQVLERVDYRSPCG